jgi:hypothetical protein
MVISIGEYLLGTSAMRWGAVFLMGNSFSDLEDMLIPFLDSHFPGARDFCRNSRFDDYLLPRRYRVSRPVSGATTSAMRAVLETY